MGKTSRRRRRTEACRRNITILQLLTHTSGLSYDLHMMNGGREWPGKGVSMQEWCVRLCVGECEGDEPPLPSAARLRLFDWCGAKAASSGARCSIERVGHTRCA